MPVCDKVAMALQAAEADCLERGEVMGYGVLADAAIAALHPVIETVEQLDALPVGTVVRTTEGRVAVKNSEHRGDSWWSEADEEEFDCGSDELDDLPARVLYTPEADR